MTQGMPVITLADLPLERIIACKFPHDTRPLLLHVEPDDTAKWIHFDVKLTGRVFIGDARSDFPARGLIAATLKQDHKVFMFESLDEFLGWYLTEADQRILIPQDTIVDPLTNPEDASSV